MFSFYLLLRHGASSPSSLSCRILAPLLLLLLFLIAISGASATTVPSRAPSKVPSRQPSVQPSRQPSTAVPSRQPSYGFIVTATENTKIVASDSFQNDYFGVSVSMYGNMLAVGAYQDDTYRGDVPVCLPKIYTNIRVI